MASTDQNLEEALYNEWNDVQERELSQLNQAIALNADGRNSDADLRQLLDTIIGNFKEYMDNRSRMARRDTAPFFAPSWCSTLVRSELWIAGCRPSSYIRLIYALCGMDVESDLSEFLQGAKVAASLGGLSGEQILKIDKLQGETVKEEDKLSSRMASLQEDIADLYPLVSFDKLPIERRESPGDVDEALDKHGQNMAGLLEEADKLRLKTTEEVIRILVPIQAVKFLAAGKKLSLCLQEWGKKRDQAHGRK